MAVTAARKTNFRVDLHIQAEVARSLLHTVREALGDDEEAKVDTIEGETNLLEVIDATLSRLAELEDIEAAIADRIKSLKMRQERMANGQEVIRLAIMRAMGAVDLRKLERPEATLSVGRTPQKVVVTSEADLPSEYMRERAPVPDLKLIGEALKGGTAVPGAELSNGGETLSVRRK